jgi:hypothetical protein
MALLYRVTFHNGRRVLGWLAGSTARVNVVIALLGLALFGAVLATSGRVTVNDGEGWDGSAYAAMVRGRLADGNVPTQTRPLIPLVARLAYKAELNVVDAFHVTNIVSAFALYLLTCLILDRYRVGTLEKAFFVANLALSIATAKMFAFYPVLVDLGALAVLMLATYAILADGAWLAGAAVVVAVTAREFAAALAFMLIVRSIRHRRGMVPAAVGSAGGIAALFAIRWWAATTNVGDSTTALTTGGSLLANLDLWRDPAFVAFFVYFLVTLIGGVTALLAGRILWCVKTLVRRPELGIYAGLIVAVTAAGNADIWRYLVFLLPVVTILFGKFVREFRPHPIVLGVALVLTIVTQEPFSRMTVGSYFQDWFPVYRVREGDVLPGFWSLWMQRFLVTVVLFAALTLLQRLRLRRRMADAGPITA